MTVTFFLFVCFLQSFKNRFSTINDCRWIRKFFSRLKPVIIHELYYYAVCSPFHRVNGCYENLDGGTASEAMEDLTGGLAERESGYNNRQHFVNTPSGFENILLTFTDYELNNPPANLLDIIQQSFKLGALMSSALTVCTNGGVILYLMAWDFRPLLDHLLVFIWLSIDKEIVPGSFDGFMYLVYLLWQSKRHKTPDFVWSTLCTVQYDENYVKSVHFGVDDWTYCSLAVTVVPYFRTVYKTRSKKWMKNIFCFPRISGRRFCSWRTSQ